MLLNKNDGSISKFITIEAPATNSPILPDYEIYQGMFYDDRPDRFDSKLYFYLSFVYD